MNALDNLAKQALSDAGAQCGVCGDQPGDRICPDCERCYEEYVDALRAAGWAPSAEVRAEQAAEIERLRTELEPYEALNPQQCPKGLHPDWLVDSEHAHACPWCRIAELETALASQGIKALREAADDCDEAGAAYTARALNEQAGGAFALMEHFQQKANQAEYAATECDFVACEPGGEPCSTHERLMAHAEGDHELCGDECTAITCTAP